MKCRNVTPLILRALADTPVVFLQGPRQSGKTTLVQDLRQHNFEADYLTLDDAAVLAAAKTDPDGFIDGLPKRVILDEIQRVPELFRSIKRNVDANRQPGRFLLTGSAHALVLPAASESLAGRMEILPLWPFSQGELEDRRDCFVDACFALGFTPAIYADSDWSSLIARMVQGGYPEALMRANPQRREAWFGSYITTILERDVRDITNVQALRDLPRLLRIIAARAAGLLSFSELSRDAGMPQTTLHRYWSLFEAVFLVRSLPAWSANLGVRLAKAPKALFGDTGLLCYLIGLDTARLLSDDLMAGAVLESFVGSELIKQISWSNTRLGLFHYRTHRQQEVDFVLEDRHGRLVGIEVKKTTSPTAGDFKGLRHLKEHTGERFLRGILLYTGTQSVGFGPDLYAVPVSALWQMAPPAVSSEE